MIALYDLKLIQLFELLLISERTQSVSNRYNIFYIIILNYMKSKNAFCVLESYYIQEENR